MCVLCLVVPLLPAIQCLLVDIPLQEGWFHVLLVLILASKLSPPPLFFQSLSSLFISFVTHSSTLAWKIPWTEEPGRLQSMRSQRVGHDWATSLSLSCIGEGNGNPLQCSCLENPSDRGAWWAAICGVAQSWTRLKRLSSSSSTTTKQHAGHKFIFWGFSPASQSSISSSSGNFIIHIDYPFHTVV